MPVGGGVSDQGTAQCEAGAGGIAVTGLESETDPGRQVRLCLTVQMLVE